jgi:hypothetical protein
MTNTFQFQPTERPLPMGERIVAHIQEVADAATEADRRAVSDICERAIASAAEPELGFAKFTPGMAALLFLQHNAYNRSWRPDWTSVLAGTMRAGDWRKTSQGYSFYGDDGSVADGAHRLAAQAESGTELVMSVYFGASKTDVATLDCGKPRAGADVAALAGVTNAKEKEALLQALWSYEKGAGIPGIRFHSPAEVAKEISSNDALLARALEIGRASVEDANDPVLQGKVAAKVAGLCLRHQWPETRLIERLEELQIADFASDKAPLCQAKKYIEDHRKPADTITPQREIGMVIRAMTLAESGVTNARKTEIQSAAKHLPDPTYPAGQKYSNAAE